MNLYLFIYLLQWYVKRNADYDANVKILRTTAGAHRRVAALGHATHVWRYIMNDQRCVIENRWRAFNDDIISYFILYMYPYSLY